MLHYYVLDAQRVLLVIDTVGTVVAFLSQLSIPFISICHSCTFCVRRHNKIPFILCSRFHDCLHYSIHETAVSWSFIVSFYLAECDFRFDVVLSSAPLKNVDTFFRYFLICSTRVLRTILFYWKSIFCASLRELSEMRYLDVCVCERSNRLCAKRKQSAAETR